MIRETQTSMQQPGEKVHGNAVDAELASLQKSRDYAIERQKLGEDVSALLAYYDEKIARLMYVR